MTPSPFTFMQGFAGVGRIAIATQSSLASSIAEPPCACLDCHDAFYTVEEQLTQPMTHAYRDWLSDAEAERRAASAIKKIHDCRNALQASLDVFADVLMSRWRKLSQAKRELLLNQAAAGLADKQWFLPRHLLSGVNSRSQKVRRQLLLPWLNVEVLKTNPTVLLALLHCRTAYPPHRWATFDSRQISMSWHKGLFDVDFSRKCVVLLGEKYGSLVDWEKETAHRADTLGFPRARLVLEAQAHLMQTLHDVASKILSGVDHSHPPRIGKWKSLVDSHAFTGTGVVEYWSAYTNPAFSPPAHFDSKYMLSLAKTRKDATADHLLHLQCDAAYMRRHLKIRMATEVFKKASETARALMIVQDIRLEVRSHHWWQWLEMECRHVDEVRDRCRDDIQPGAALPVQYDRALGALELLLIEHVVYRAKRLEQLLPFAPGFQDYWTFTAHPSRSDTIGTVRSEADPNSKDMLKNDPLYWSFFQLLGVPDEHHHFDHSMLFAILEEQLARHASERSRLDEVMYQVLSDLAVCHEMLTAVRSHRPRNKARDPEEALRTENRQSWRRVEHGQFGGRTTGSHEEFAIVDRTGDQQALTMMSRVTHKTAAGREMGALLLRGLYDVNPPAGPKTLAWLEKHRELRACLETFWDFIRETFQRDFEASDLRPAEIRGLMEVVSASLSKTYAREKQQEDEAIFAAIRERETPQPFQKFVQMDAPVPKVGFQQMKKKTRGHSSTNAPAREDTPTEHADSGNVIKAAPIRVTKHSLDVFQIMFPAKGNAATKDVLWDRFVHAMADASFIARNAGGSLVSFRNPASEGRIVFHRPHPDSKIDPIMLQAMGKRLAKWFGWRRDLFLLRDEPATD